MTRLKKIAKEDVKYNVVAGGGISDINGFTGTNNPEEAIKIWCQMQESNPTNVSIVAKSNDSIELLNWAKNNKEKVSEMMEQYNVNNIYNIDYILNSLDNAKGVYQAYDRMGGDQVDPFSMG